MRLSPVALRALAIKGAVVRLQQLTHEVAALQQFLQSHGQSNGSATPTTDRRAVWTAARRKAHAKRMRAAWRTRRNGGK